MSTQLQRRWIPVAACLLAAAGTLAGESAFRPKTADKYPSKQKQDGLIVAAKAFVSEKDQKSAFGKVRPRQYGIVPMLLVISNTGTHSFSLESLQVRLITPGREGLEPIRGEDLAALNPKGHQPTRRTIPGVPGLSRTRVKRGPLDRPEIMRHEFRAPIVAPKSTASGFFFYQVGPDSSLEGASAYISGVVNISTGRELFYFEIPLDKR